MHELSLKSLRIWDLTLTQSLHWISGEQCFLFLYANMGIKALQNLLIKIFVGEPEVPITINLCLQYKTPRITSSAILSHHFSHSLVMTLLPSHCREKSISVCIWFQVVHRDTKPFICHSMIYMLHSVWNTLLTCGSVQWIPLWHIFDQTTKWLQQDSCPT